jgi:hypothetical protein
MRDKELKSLPKIRIARPTHNIQKIQAMYMQGLGLEFLGDFRNHDGYDGVMLGLKGQPYHLEFTNCSRTNEIERRPSTENLLVFYYPDINEWQFICESMISAGFTSVPSENPYWDKSGKSFEDLDGYRIVIQNQNSHF